MNAALGTLPFLATLWLLAVLGANVLEESGAKIVAALKGTRTPKQPVTSMRVRMGVGTQRPMRARTQLRAAA